MGKVVDCHFLFLYISDKGLVPETSTKPGLQIYIF